MSAQIPSPHDVALDNWTHALQTYRASVDLYTRVLKIRRRRDVQPLRTRNPGRAVMPAAPLSAPVLDELTAREREVALLIARGLSNRQIAQTLVITAGTAANHVARVIEKTGLRNRTRVAATVAAQIGAADSTSPGEPIRLVGRSRATTNANEIGRLHPAI